MTQTLVPTVPPSSLSEACSQHMESPRLTAPVTFPVVAEADAALGLVLLDPKFRLHGSWSLVVPVTRVILGWSWHSNSVVLFAELHCTPHALCTSPPTPRRLARANFPVYAWDQRGVEMPSLTSRSGRDSSGTQVEGQRPRPHPCMQLVGQTWAEDHPPARERWCSWWAEAGTLPSDWTKFKSCLYQLQAVCPYLPELRVSRKLNEKPLQVCHKNQMRCCVRIYVAK